MKGNFAFLQQLKSTKNIFFSWPTILHQRTVEVTHQWPPRAACQAHLEGKLNWMHFNDFIFLWITCHVEKQINPIKIVPNKIFLRRSYGRWNQKPTGTSWPYFFSKLVFFCMSVCVWERERESEWERERERDGSIRHVHIQQIISILT